MQKDVGKVTVNCEGGIFGTVTEPEIFAGQPVPVATPQQVQTGDAVIRCTVCGGETKEYQVKITKIFGDEDSTGICCCASQTRICWSRPAALCRA